MTDMTNIDRLNLEIPIQLINHYFGRAGVKVLLDKLEKAGELEEGKLLTTLTTVDIDDIQQLAQSGNEITFSDLQISSNAYDRLNLTIPSDLVDSYLNRQGLEILIGLLEFADKLTDDELLVTLQHRDIINAKGFDNDKQKVILGGQVYQRHTTPDGPTTIMVGQPNSGEILTESLSPEGGRMLEPAPLTNGISTHIGKFVDAGKGIFLSAQFEDYGLSGEILVEYIITE